MDRRHFLSSGLALGCSAAASPLLAPMALASAPWDARLVVIILRGGMDGIDVIRPYGDQAFYRTRGDLTRDAVEDGGDLGGFFALHPALMSLYPLWQAGEFGAMHAVSTPYRDKRSHFDGQDMLEAGTDQLPGPRGRDGWLNRMLQTVPGVESETTFAIGREDLIVTSGDAPISRWSPDAQLSLSPQARTLLELVYENDPLFHAASSDAIAIAEQLKIDSEAETSASEMMMSDPMMEQIKPNSGHVKVARFAANRLRGSTRVAAFSLNGWDTHFNQAKSLPRALSRLSDTILTLKAGLGPVWDKTAVLALTEFGRTAKQNGTGGTDHGTGGAMLFAGGAVRGGQILGDWPGLNLPDLYAGRDLMPTRDVRAGAAWAMRGLFGLDRAVLEDAIFPGLDLGPDLKLIA
ncbi:DUF1501 domain-containing protein [Aestuariibius insulae]|uniref:DUF1501 domain-containing protein n=1 Tax=Aestuariibius insulae TaxID=2058287 RepID=UPI00345EB86C